MAKLLSFNNLTDLIIMQNFYIVLKIRVVTNYLFHNSSMQDTESLQ